MQPLIEQLFDDEPEWQQLCKRLQNSSTLTALVLTAWQMGRWFAKAIVEQQLQSRASVPTQWQPCPVCHTPLHSKGFAKRRILTLVGWVEWQRRVGRCRHHCRGSQAIPFDEVLGIAGYQQTSTELKRLGCLLAVFLPFEVAAWMLQQLIGVTVSHDTIWQWVQSAGHKAMAQLDSQLQDLAWGYSPELDSLDEMLKTMPLIIAADGVTVPFRSLPKTPKGKIIWKEIKVALFARLGKHLTSSGNPITRLHQRRFVAVLGDIEQLKSRLQLESLRQGVTTASLVAWISDGTRGFWRLFQECFAGGSAVGILDFYHATQHLWQAATAYRDGNPARTPQQWFERMRHQLRYGRGKKIIQELNWLSKSKNTSEETKPILRQVRDYLSAHLEHIQYRQFKQQLVVAWWRVLVNG